MGRIDIIKAASFRDILGVSGSVIQSGSSLVTCASVTYDDKGKSILSPMFTIDTSLLQNSQYDTKVADGTVMATYTDLVTLQGDKAASTAVMLSGLILSKSVAVLQVEQPSTLTAITGVIAFTGTPVAIGTGSVDQEVIPG